MGLPRSLGFAAAVLGCVLGAGCHLVSGVEEYSMLDPASGPAGTTGTGASGAAGGASTSSGAAGSTGTGATGSGTTTDGGGDGGTGCVLEDCPGLKVDCSYPACVNEQCDIVIAMTETTCDDDGGHYCDGKGACLECLGDEHCGNDGTCQSGKCHAAGCGDGQKNQNETDIDCGGVCGPCDNGKACSIYTDCKSLICPTSTHVCTPCGTEADCVGDRYCDIDGSLFCLPKKSLGANCVHNYECKTGKCVWVVVWMCGL